MIPEDLEVHYLRGQLEEADRQIAQLEKYRTRVMRQRLKMAKAARKEVVEKLNARLDNSIIISRDKAAHRE